ncbi:MAG: 30S ribosomal protein S17 [Deltaproteobacteria bacterium]
MARGKMKTRVGLVTSDKMDKTVVVDVIHIVSNLGFNKPVKRTSRFKAHDEKNECKVGDKVIITESRPLSRTKSWRVTEILERKFSVEADIVEQVSAPEVK